MQNHWLFLSNNIYFSKCQKADEKEKKRKEDQGRIQKIQKEGAESRTLPPPPPNENFTFQDMQHTALWAYSWCKVK